MSYFEKLFLEISSEEKHKNITKDKKIYILGGLFYLIGILFIEINPVFKVLCGLIYFVGFFSDNKILSSPNLRLILQALIIFFTVIYLNIKIENTRIDLIDHFLKFEIFSILFTVFCLMILINGSNFIDGVNCNLIFYYLIITLVIIVLYNNNLFFPIEINHLYIIFFVLLLILLLNFNGIIISGDAGAYLISFFWGVNLISISNENFIISPFFIVLLLWYPAFENLFSVLRKTKIKKSALNADFKHFHQLLYIYIKKKFKIKLIANNLSGILINLYNLLIFIFSLKYYYDTQVLVMIIFFNICLYLFIYSKILSFFKKH